MEKWAGWVGFGSVQVRSGWVNWVADQIGHGSKMDCFKLLDVSETSMQPTSGVQKTDEPNKATETD